MPTYTKAKLEELLYKQLDNIDALNDQVQLLQEQNIIYRALNKKLTTEQLDNQHPKLYPKRKRKKARPELILTKIVTRKRPAGSK